jgi:hypothetical protein
MMEDGARRRRRPLRARACEEGLCPRPFFIITSSNVSYVRICERFHRTMLDEFYRVAFRKKLYASLEELQRDADEWIEHYNSERAHSGKYCYGKTPMETFRASKKLADEKMLDMLLAGSAAESAGAQAVG